jgi:hypothetical protein
MQWRSNSKLLIQNAHTMTIFIDMMRLTYQRHAAYCVSHGFDYWHHIGNPCPEREWGAWDKVHLIREALSSGYEFIAWLDTDAVISGDADLSDTLQAGQHIGGCVHDANGIPRHINVGVLYFRNTPETVQFVENWHAGYPGDNRWREQGTFNDLITKYPGVVTELPDTWNSTYRVNQIEGAAVMAWHGVVPLPRRFEMMKSTLVNDYLKYRV